MNIVIEQLMYMIKFRLMSGTKTQEMFDLLKELELELEELKDTEPTIEGIELIISSLESMNGRLRKQNEEDKK